MTKECWNRSRSVAYVDQYSVRSSMFYIVCVTIIDLSMFQMKALLCNVECGVVQFDVLPLDLCRSMSGA